MLTAVYSSETMSLYVTGIVVNMYKQHTITAEQAMVEIEREILHHNERTAKERA